MVVKTTHVKEKPEKIADQIATMLWCQSNYATCPSNSADGPLKPLKNEIGTNVFKSRTRRFVSRESAFPRINLGILQIHSRDSAKVNKPSRSLNKSLDTLSVISKASGIIGDFGSPMLRTFGEYASCFTFVDMLRKFWKENSWLVHGKNSCQDTQNIPEFPFPFLRIHKSSQQLKNS
jgi:hypothetical protein